MTRTEQILAAVNAHDDLARAIAPHWANVFTCPHDEPPLPGEEPSRASAHWQAWADAKAKRSAWEVKRDRAGRLQPDAAFEVAALLTAAAAADGNPFTVKEVLDAHREAVRVAIF